MSAKYVVRDKTSSNSPAHMRYNEACPHLPTSLWECVCVHTHTHLLPMSEWACRSENKLVIQLAEDFQLMARIKYKQER